MRFFLILLFLSISAHAERTIHVHTRVEIRNQEQITLGDIAKIDGFAGDELQDIKRIRLGDAPPAGESRTFSSAALSSLYRAHLKRIELKDGEKVSLRTPQKITVYRLPNTLEAREVERKLREELQVRCEDCEFEFQALSMPILGEPLAAGATWSLKLPTDVIRGSFNVPVEVKNTDGTRRLYWISGHSVIRKRVPVVSRNLVAGERLLENDISYQVKDVTFVTDSFPSAEEIKGSVLARPVSAGQPLSRSYLRREAAVRMGDIVRVITGSEKWQISVEGVAQQVGYLGDHVRIKIPRTQKIVSGLLVEKGLVEVRQ